MNTYSMRQPVLDLGQRSEDELHKHLYIDVCVIQIDFILFICFFKLIHFSLERVFSSLTASEVISGWMIRIFASKNMAHFRPT